MKGRNSWPVLVSAGGMQHYGDSLQQACKSDLGIDLDHFHVDTTRNHPDGEMHGGILPEGLYEVLHGREVLPIISMQDVRFLEGLRLIGYVRTEIMNTDIPLVLSPCAASARADKDQGKVSGRREMPYHRVDLELMSHYADWLLAIDHHNAEQAKGRATKLKNLKNSKWLAEIIKSQAENFGVQKLAHLSPDESAHQRVVQTSADITAILGAPLNQFYAEKQRDDVTGKTSIVDMRMGALKFGEEWSQTTIESLKPVEVLVVSDDILSSGGTMMKSVVYAIKKGWLPSLKKVVFVATHFLASSADTPSEFTQQTLQGLNEFSVSAEMQGIKLEIVAGDTMSNPIGNLADNQGFTFQRVSTTSLVTKQLGLNWGTNR